jgi:hypothetical protein
MEMINVLQRLKEIQEATLAPVGDAIANVEKTNANIKIEGAVKGWLMDMEQDAAEMSKEEFIKKHGSSHMDIWNRIQQEKEELGESKKTLVKEEDAYDNERFMIKNGKATKDNSDTADKKEKEEVGESKKTLVKEEDAYDNDRFIIKNGKATLDNSDMADKKDHVYAPDAKTALQLHKQGKKVYKESIQMTADTPEEASMLMQILKLAGVQKVDDQMINQNQEGSSCGGCDENCECGGNCGDNCACGNKAEETYDNEPNTSVKGVDAVLPSGNDLHRAKSTYPKVAGGDNPMQKATEDMTSSLRNQYAEFKANYLNAVNEQKKDK